MTTQQPAPEDLEMSQLHDAELERRVRRLEAQDCGADFDGMAWFWLIALGVIVPVVLLLMGWNT